VAAKAADKAANNFVATPCIRIETEVEYQPRKPLIEKAVSAPCIAKENVLPRSAIAGVTVPLIEEYTVIRGGSTGYVTFVTPEEEADRYEEIDFDTNEEVPEPVVRWIRKMGTTSCSRS
jgi:hypothetical protein